MGQVLDRAALLGAAEKSSLPTERVSVPELGGDVIIRGMSGLERDAWETSLITGAGKKQKVNTQNIRAKLVTRTLCDENGQRILQDGDEAILGRLRVDVLTKLYEVAQRLSGVSDEDVDELGKISALVAGSGSPSSSQSSSAG